jgi:hypothetical protein
MEDAGEWDEAPDGGAGICSESVPGDEGAAGEVPLLPGRGGTEKSVWEESAP